MTDTTITDAEAFPMDDGSGVSDGDESYDSAAWFGLLSRYKGDGSYVGEDTSGSATLQFNDVDTTNEEVDVGQGYAYITESGHSVQSRPQTTYDTNVPIGVPYVALLPTEVTNLALGTDTGNDLWLAVDPTAASDPVYIRHGSGLAAPSDPSVKLGTVNTSTGATTRANDLYANTGSRIDLTELNGGVTGSSSLTNIAGDNLTIDGSGNLDASGGMSVTASDSNTTTSGAGVYLIDTSGGARTLTLASADATSENAIGAVNVSGTNALTVDTESTETIDPGGASSKTLSTGGYLVWFNGDGTDWDSSLDVDVESVTTDQATLNGGDGHTIGNDTLVGVPDSTTSISPGFGSWTQASSTRPAKIFIRLVAETDGTSAGSIRLKIDESGGTTSDYFYQCYSDSTQGAGTQEQEHFAFLLPPGGQYIINNNVDPNNNNRIDFVREVIL